MFTDSALGASVVATVLRGRPLQASTVRPGGAGKRPLREGGPGGHEVLTRRVRARVVMAAVHLPVMAERVLVGSIARDEETRIGSGDTP